MRRMMSMLLLGAAIAVSFVHLAGCEDDTTINPATFDSGAKEGGEGGEAGGEAGKADAGQDAAAHDAADAADATDAADGD